MESVDLPLRFTLLVSRSVYTGIITPSLDSTFSDLKLSDAGTQTCSGYPGSLGNEAIDAATFAGWGIDCMFDLSCIIFPPKTNEAVRRLEIWYSMVSSWKL